MSSWAFLEFNTTGAIHHLLGADSPEITDAVFGVLDYKTRLAKLIKLAKLRGANKELKTYLNEISDSLEVPRNIRNLVAHLPVTGWDKSDKNVFYLHPFHGADFKKSDRVVAYKLKYTEVQQAADYAADVGKTIYKKVTTELPLV